MWIQQDPNSFHGNKGTVKVVLERVRYFPKDTESCQSDLDYQKVNRRVPNLKQNERELSYLCR